MLIPLISPTKALANTALAAGDGAIEAQPRRHVVSFLVPVQIAVTFEGTVGAAPCPEAHVSLRKGRAVTLCAGV